MFVSYTYRYVHTDNPFSENDNRNFINIFDTDFNDADNIFKVKYNNMPTHIRVPIQVSVAITNIYEKRKLNVAANLTLALTNIRDIFISGYYRGPEECWRIEDMIKNISIHNPQFKKYEKDIEKYLVLL